MLEKWGVREAYNHCCGAGGGKMDSDKNGAEPLA
jgi:hypothetical protein